MNLQKINKTIKQDQTLSMKKEDYLQTLERSKITMIKTESLGTLTATYTDT